MPRVSYRAAGVCAALALAFATRVAAQEGTWALTNARIETVTHGVIERGTIVIRDGLITAVGADVTAPADARVLDLTGRTVYPGIIDLTSSLGLPTAAPGGGGPPQAGGGGQVAGGAAATAAAAGRTWLGLDPQRTVAEELRAAQNDIKTARDAGITVVLTAPVRGAFRGRSALVPLRDSVDTRDVVRSPVALHMGYQGMGGGFGGGGAGGYPATLLGVIAYERQHLYDARRQALLNERYRANPRGMQRPPNDDTLNALIPVVRGELPVFFAASNENEIRRAFSIAREFNLQMTVVGATEGFRALDVLQGSRRPVVVSVDYPLPTAVTGWQYRNAQRSRQDSAAADSAGRRILEGNPAALMRAGVRFALASGGRPADLLSNVRKAIAAGLPRDTALAALTLRPAEIAGVGEQLGSVDVGKTANLVVSEGDLLGDSAKVRMVFVDGIRYVVDPPPVAARGPGGRRGGPGGATEAPAQVGGTWDITVTSPQGSNAVTMVVTQSGATFSGTMASQMGTTEVGGGTIEGRRLTWTTTITISNQQITATYTGDVDGNRITGNVAVGELGTFPFTGEKRP